MIKILSFKICPFVQRVTALLEARKMPYQLEYISPDRKPDWFLGISPNGQVPVLITDEGEALFESDAIVEYIDEIHSPLEDGISPEQRARNRAWSHQAVKLYLAQCSAMRSPDADILEERKESLKKAFARIEAVLGEGPYFNGEQLGNVDIAWMVLLHRVHIIKRHTGYDFLAGFPRIREWQEALMATGLAQRSVADDFEDVFTGFYLSGETFLGRCNEQCAEERPVVRACC